MKKRIFSLAAMLLFLGSSINLNANSNASPVNNQSLVQVSCFELAHYYADWFCSGLDFGCTGGFDKLEIVLAWTESCESSGILN